MITVAAPYPACDLTATHCTSVACWSSATANSDCAGPERSTTVLSGHASACDAFPVVYVLDWDSKLSGGQLCLYQKSSGNQSSTCGQQVTLVPPVGDTLVIFDSHVEHEVLPSFADRSFSCTFLETRQHQCTVHTLVI